MGGAGEDWAVPALPVLGGPNAVIEGAVTPVSANRPAGDRPGGSRPPARRCIFDGRKAPLDRPDRIAQLVEQETFNLQVVGSIPTPVTPR